MKLTPGSAARVYRDGAGEPVGQYEVPRDGSALTIRDLAPGAYEARDECGKTHRFLVEVGEEVAVIEGQPVHKETIAPDARAVEGAPGSAKYDEDPGEVVGSPGDATSEGVLAAVRDLPDEEQRLHGLPVHGEPEPVEADAETPDEVTGHGGAGGATITQSPG
jgi:hypothetical protein